jgi:predicted Zn-dependent protease
MNPTEQTGFSRRSLFRLAAALPVAASSARLEAKEPDPFIAPFNKMTDEQEIALGREVAAELEDAKWPLLHVSPMDQYINGMVQKLARASKRPNMDYVAKVVNTTEMNAKTLPGGHIFVFRGLLDDVQSEAELACVLGHEVGHVVGHHGANFITGSQVFKGYWEQLQKYPQLQKPVIREIVQKYGGPLAFLALMKFSRENEFQADLFGFYEALRCNWDVHGFVTLMDRWASKYEGQPRSPIDELKRTHPPSAERAARFRQEIGTVSLPGKMTTDSLAFKAMKLALKVLPPPKKAEQG